VSKLSNLYIEYIEYSDQFYIEYNQYSDQAQGIVLPRKGDFLFTLGLGSLCLTSCIGGECSLDNSHDVQDRGNLMEDV